MFKRPWLAAAFFFLLAAGAARAEQAPADAPAPASEESKWKEFTNTAGKFTVEMPGKHTEMKQAVQLPTGPLIMKMSYVEVPGKKKVFLVLYCDYPANEKYGQEDFDYTVLEGVMGGIARSRKAENQKKSKVKLDSHHGLKCSWDVPGDRKLLCQVYLVGNRLYQLHAEWPASDEKGPAEAARFMKSFKRAD